MKNKLCVTFKCSSQDEGPSLSAASNKKELLKAYKDSNAGKISFDKFLETAAKVLSFNYADGQMSIDTKYGVYLVDLDGVDADYLNDSIEVWENVTGEEVTWI